MKAGNSALGASTARYLSFAIPELRDPFPVDPGVVERGVREHARLQNALAAHIETRIWFREDLAPITRHGICCGETTARSGLPRSRA
jgi:hypothetical protein